MKTKLRTNAKNDLAKDFFKLMSNSEFGKTIENVKKPLHIKLVTSVRQRNRLVSEPNYCITKWFSEKLLAIKTKQKEVKINKPVYLGL